MPPGTLFFFPLRTALPPPPPAHRCGSTPPPLSQALSDMIGLDPNKPIIIAGHSLGGALATLLAYDAMRWFPGAARRMLLVTYGSPRVGDKRWAAGFDGEARGCGLPHYRLVNGADVVPKLGPRPLYEHCGQEVRFELRLRGGRLRDHVQAYTRWLQGEGGQPGGPEEEATRSETFADPDRYL